MRQYEVYLKYTCLFDFFFPKKRVDHKVDLFCNFIAGKIKGIFNDVYNPYRVGGESFWVT